MIIELKKPCPSVLVPVFFLAFLAFSGASLCQAPSEADSPTVIPPVTERLTVELIQLEVRIVDKKGNFVPGLGVQDFTVFEDETEQKLLYVDEFNPEKKAVRGEIPGRVLDPEKAEPPVPPEVSGSLIIIVDSANSSLDSISRQKDFLRRFLLNFNRPDILVAVFQLRADGVFKMVSDFTSDHDETIRGIEQVQAGTGGSQYRQARQQEMEDALDLKLNLCSTEEGTRVALCRETAFDRVVNTAIAFAQEERSKAINSMTSLRQILKFSGHLPGQRNALLISEGIDPGGLSYFNTAAKLLRFYSQNYNVRDTFRWISEIQRASTVFTTDLNVFETITRAALSSGVTLNWINPSHSGGLSAFTPDSALGSYTVGSDYVSVQDSIGLMIDLARDTGGLALPRAAGIKGFYDQLADDIGSYYLLSYSPDREFQDGKRHEVKVKTRDKGLRIRMREEYIDVPKETRVMQKLSSVLDFPQVFDRMAVESLLTFLQLGSEDYAVTLRMAVPYHELVPDIDDDVVRDTLHFGFVVRKQKDGEIVSSEHPLLNISQEYGDFAKLVKSRAYIDYRQNFTLKPGEYEIVAAVLDENGGGTAAKRYSLTLPEMKAGCLNVTPLMLANRVTQVTKRSPELVFDKNGDALHGDRRLTFSAVLNQPSTGTLSGLYQILSAGRGPDDNPSVEISFRLFREDTYINQTPPTVLGSFTGAANRSITNVFAVPYSGLATGTYRLELTAKDRITGCLSRAGTVFRVVDSPHRP